MKITIEANSEGVFSICNMLENIVTNPNYLTIEEKVFKNIAFQIYDKFYSLKTKILKKSNLSTNNNYKINLQYYECWALHNFIMSLIYLEENEYRKKQIQEISNQLHYNLHKS